MRASIHVVTNERNSSLALLLESLRQQTYKEWDLVILDNNKVFKVMTDHILRCLLNRIQYEGHRIFIIDNSKDEGPRDVGRYRNMVVEGDSFAVFDKKDQNRTNEIGVRIDDDSVIEKNYLEIITNPFVGNTTDVGVVGGICPYFWAPTTHAPLPAKFNTIYSTWKWDDHCIYFFRMLDEKGNDKFWTDTFFESGHIRSNYAYRIDLARKIKFPEYTGPSGFTEETSFCAKVWMEGYKVLINPNAIAWHLAVPFGGGRDKVTTQEQMEEIKKTNLERLEEELGEYRIAKGLEKRQYP